MLMPRVVSRFCCIFLATATICWIILSLVSNNNLPTQKIPPSVERAFHRVSDTLRALGDHVDFSWDGPIRPSYKYFPPPVHYQRDPRGAIDIFERRGFVVCRIYVACRERSSQILLPLWMRNYANVLAEKCALSNFRFVHYTRLENYPPAPAVFDWLGPQVPPPALRTFVANPLSYFFAANNASRSKLKPTYSLRRSCISPNESKDRNISVCDEDPEPRIARPAVIINVDPDHPFAQNDFHVVLRQTVRNVYATDLVIFEPTSEMLGRPRMCFRSIISSPATDRLAGQTIPTPAEFEPSENLNNTISAVVGEALEEADRAIDYALKGKNRMDLSTFRNQYPANENENNETTIRAVTSTFTDCFQDKNDSSGCLFLKKRDADAKKTVNQSHFINERNHTDDSGTNSNREIVLKFKKETNAIEKAANESTVPSFSSSNVSNIHNMEFSNNYIKSKSSENQSEEELVRPSKSSSNHLQQKGRSKNVKVNINPMHTGNQTTKLGNSALHEENAHSVQGGVSVGTEGLNLTASERLQWNVVPEKDKNESNKNVHEPEKAGNKLDYLTKSSGPKLMKNNTVVANTTNTKEDIARNNSEPVESESLGLDVGHESSEEGSFIDQSKIAKTVIPDIENKTTELEVETTQSETTTIEAEVQKLLEQVENTSSHSDISIPPSSNFSSQNIQVLNATLETMNDTGYENTTLDNIFDLTENITTRFQLFNRLLPVRGPEATRANVDQRLMDQGGVELFTHRTIDGDSWNASAAKNSHYGVCRLYKACRNPDSTLLLPEWLRKFKARLTQHCGLPNANFIPNVEFDIMYKKLWQVDEPHGFIHLFAAAGLKSRQNPELDMDLIGTRVYRAQEQHFVTDMFHDAIHALDAVLIIEQTMTAHFDENAFTENLMKVMSIRQNVENPYCMNRQFGPYLL